MLHLYLVPDVGKMVGKWWIVGESGDKKSPAYETGLTKRYKNHEKVRIKYEDTKNSLLSYKEFIGQNKSGVMNKLVETDRYKEPMNFLVFPEFWVNATRNPIGTPM